MKLIDPAETLAMALDWSDWLGEETIVDSSWSVDPDATLTGEDSSDTAASVFLAGCTHGLVYTLSNQIATSGGQTAERSITVRCLER